MLALSQNPPGLWFDYFEKGDLPTLTDMPITKTMGKYIYIFC